MACKERFGVRTQHRSCKSSFLARSACLWLAMSWSGLLSNDLALQTRGAESDGAYLQRHALDVGQALESLDSPLPTSMADRLSRLCQQTDGDEAAIQRILDSQSIACVTIDADRRLAVRCSQPSIKLQQNGWTCFLVKVINQAGFQGRLDVRSPNSEPLFVETRGQTRMMQEEMFTEEQLAERFLALSLHRNSPLKPLLSGHRVEYMILQVYSKRAGRLIADLDFYIGDYYQNMRALESSYLGCSVDGVDQVGLRGVYFNGDKPSGTPVLHRVDRTIDFDWGQDTTPGLAVDRARFAARWTGWLIAPKSGRFRLGIRSNDGSRLYLSGKLIVSNWSLQGSTLRTAEVTLKGGERYDLVVEYFQGGGSASMRLEWDDGPLNPTRIRLQCDIASAVPVLLRILDDDGLPCMASLTVTDGIQRYERLPANQNRQYGQFLNHGLSDYERRAQREYEYFPENLQGIYPLPSKRLAAFDPYPDQYFHAQVYRKDGDYILLPPGSFRVTATRGPEYIKQTRTITVPERAGAHKEEFRLQRWISMRQHGYYSSDSHIHASGCCYYTNPEEGLRPEHIWRFQQGEDLNVANVLNWGGNWFHQKSHFTGRDYPHSDHHHLLRYNVEVSGFPSSHAGHVVLLGLREDDYPETEAIEDWPTWNLPILRWAKGQNALTGYAHSGWGLTPMNATWDLPNYETPRMNDIGANEFIVTVTEDVVDFYSVGDTPITWELNMWYHILNCGFRPRLSGETDFPCIYDERVGEARSYVKLNGPLTYQSYLDGLRRGSGYVSGGRCHIAELTVDGVELGSGDSTLELQEARQVDVMANVVALLSPKPDEVGRSVAASGLDRQPYWHIERARIESTRNISVELVVNGIAVDSKMITADGRWNHLSFTHRIDKSSWIALRVFPCAHTNPVFVTVDGKPIVEHESARWARRAVDQCWRMKRDQISQWELPDAIDTFDRARAVYDRLTDLSK